MFITNTSRESQDDPSIGSIVNYTLENDEPDLIRWFAKKNVKSFWTGSPIQMKIGRLCPLYFPISGFQYKTIAEHVARAQLSAAENELFDRKLGRYYGDDELKILNNN